MSRRITPKNCLSNMRAKPNKMYERDVMDLGSHETSSLNERLLLLWGSARYNQLRIFEWTKANEAAN